jgi:hypothetical protein
LSNELNAANNSKEELYQRVSTAEIACLQKEVEVERLHREIAAFAAVFNDKICAEVLAAKVAFNEWIAVQALELAATSTGSWLWSLLQQNFRHRATLNGA